MYEPHRPLEQRSKGQERQKQKGKWWSHPTEREEQERKQARQPVEHTDDVYDVIDEEMERSNTDYPKAKAKPKMPGAAAEEKPSRHWPRKSVPNVKSTGEYSKPSTVEGKDMRAEGKQFLRKVKSAVNLFGEETAASSAETAPEVPRIPTSRPKSIPEEENSLRQHPTRNAAGEISLCAAPTSSTAARDIALLASKAKKSSPVSQIAKAPTRDNKYLSGGTAYTRRKEKQPAALKQIPKPSDPEYFPPAHEGKPPKYFRAKITVAHWQVNPPLQPLSFEQGEILQLPGKMFTDSPLDEPKYVLRHRNDPNVYGCVFARDVEPVDDAAWPRRVNDVTGGRHDV